MYKRSVIVVGLRLLACHLHMTRELLRCGLFYFELLLLESKKFGNCLIVPIEIYHRCVVCTVERAVSKYKLGVFGRVVR